MTHELLSDLIASSGVDLSQLPFSTVGHDARRHISEVGVSRDLLLADGLRSAFSPDTLENMLRIVNGAQDGIRRIARIDVHEGDQPSVLGNHFHPDAERFRLIEGTAKVYTAPHNNPNDLAQFTLGPGDRIDIDRMITHTFVFAGRAVLLSEMDGRFDVRGMIPRVLVPRRSTRPYLRFGEPQHYGLTAKLLAA